MRQSDHIEEALFDAVIGMSNPEERAAFLSRLGESDPPPPRKYNGADALIHRMEKRLARRQSADPDGRKKATGTEHPTRNLPPQFHGDGDQPDAGEPKERKERKVPQV